MLSPKSGDQLLFRANVLGGHRFLPTKHKRGLLHPPLPMPLDLVSPFPARLVFPERHLVLMHPILSNQGMPFLITEQVEPHPIRPRKIHRGVSQW